MEAYTGQDIIKFNDRILKDFANGDVAFISYPNDLHGMNNGKNGNSMAAHNEQGNIAELQLRVIKGSPDDKYLNSTVISWKSRSTSFKPASAELTKIISVDGGVTNEVTTLGFVIPTRSVETKTNTDGDTEQVVSVYSFRAGTSQRALS